jgi:hypothetical protein
VTALAVGLVLGQLIGAPPTYRGAITIGDRTEIRSRGGGGGTLTGADLQTNPSGSISLSSPRSSYSMAYGPSIVFFDIGGTNDVTVNHSGGARASYSSRRYTLSFSVDGSIGKVNYIGVPAPQTLGLLPTSHSTTTPTPPPAQNPDPNAPAPAPPPPPTLLPGSPTAPVPFLLPPGILYIGSLRFGVGYGYAFSSRWNGSVNGSFGLGGGMDFESQQIVPPSRTGSVSASAGYSLSRSDALTTSVFGAYATVLEVPTLPNTDGTPGTPRYSGDFRAIGVTEGYSHVVSHSTNLSVGLGFNFVNGNPTVGPASNDLNGAGFAGVGHVIPLSGGAVLSLNGAASLGAFYNPVVGVVQQTLSLSFATGWTWRKLRAALSASGSTAIPWDENTTRTVSGSASVGYSPTRSVSVDTGVRTSRALFPPDTAPSIPWQYAVFVSLTVAAPVMRF